MWLETYCPISFNEKYVHDCGAALFSRKVRVFKRKTYTYRVLPGSVQVMGIRIAGHVARRPGRRRGRQQRDARWQFGPLGGPQLVQMLQNVPIMGIVQIRVPGRQSFQIASFAGRRQKKKKMKMMKKSLR